MNTKTDIPYDSRIKVDDTDLELPDLPGSWEWTTANHTDMTNKVNVFFGVDIYEVGGHLGEIDNWIDDGNEVWTVHVRPIVECLDDGKDTIPRETAETSENFDSLDEAIRAVPDHIGTYYE